MYKRAIVLIALALVSLAIGFGSGTLAKASSDPKSDESKSLDKVIHKAKFDKWDYTATQVGPTTYIQISSSVENKADLEKLLSGYKKEKGDAVDMFTEVPVVVLLKEPLLAKDLEKFVLKHKFSVKRYTLIAEDTTGDVITIIGTPGKDQLFPYESLNDLVKQVEANRSTTLTVKGIMSIEVVANKTSIQSMETDTSLVGIDFTPSLALYDLTKKGYIAGPHNVEIVAAPLYWSSVTK
jgi:hypothetical protein